MKYRHTFHAGNFADIHKHVTLLALLNALKRKEKGFAYLETHAGRGAYELAQQSVEMIEGRGRFDQGDYQADELREFATLIDGFRSHRTQTRAYPGSPVIAALQLRQQDRGVVTELVPSEERILEREIEFSTRMRVERADGFERLRAWLPPPERRGLIFIDPPYEESRQDFDRITAAIVDALQRFSTGIYAAWYPIKEEREVRAWLEGFSRAVGAETIASELWLYPRDSKVALNGSGMLIVNPPYQLAERMEAWLPELRDQLDVGHPGGTRITKLIRPA
ncbi:MAG: 23S rRNA (adenine(2030)-N(6))-methyltransferase RlmJ [Steroidobacteraceae bacterium]